MKVSVSSTFSAPAEQVWSLVKKSSTLVYVTRGMLGFSGESTFPENWQQGHSLSTRLCFFGWLPGWQHRITFVTLDDKQRVLSTAEGGGLISVWNHQIRVTENRTMNVTHYIDEVDIRAGLMTPLVWDII